MTTSVPSSDSRSDATLDCFTGAIALREGADAVGSSYLSDTTACEPPPFNVRTSEFRAPSPILVVGRGPATERARRRSRGVTRRARKEANRARSLPWGVVGFALGATVAATAGLYTVDRGLEAAIFACVVAGTVTLAAALGWRRRGRR